MLSDDYDIETESITDNPIPAGKDITINGTQQLNYILDIHFIPVQKLISQNLKS